MRSSRSGRFYIAGISTIGTPISRRSPELVTAGAPDSGTVWVPAFLVATEERLRWIRDDQSLHSTAANGTDGPAVVKVSRTQWNEVMAGSTAGMREPAPQRASRINTRLEEAGIVTGNATRWWSQNTFEGLDGLTPLQAWQNGEYEAVEELVDTMTEHATARHG